MAPVSLEGKRELLRVTVPKAYLERAKGQFEEPLDLDGILRGEGEDDVVDSKEGDQQEGGLGQAPADTDLLWCPAPPHGRSSRAPPAPLRRPAAVPQTFAVLSFILENFQSPHTHHPGPAPYTF